MIDVASNLSLGGTLEGPKFEAADRERGSFWEGTASSTIGMDKSIVLQAE